MRHGAHKADIHRRPDMYEIRPMCDGYDVSVDGRVLHFTSRPSDADVAAVLLSLVAAQEPTVSIAAEDGEVL
jgi:hypothetical protein